jgi:hypothetical protein
MTLIPTHKLRWLIREGSRVLQQFFCYTQGTNGLWIDVPEVME